MRDELDARFAATIAAAGAATIVASGAATIVATGAATGAAGGGGPARPDDWPPYALPAPLAASIAEAAARRLCPPSLIAHYTERMPRMLVEQSRPDDEPRRLLHRPLALERLPRTRAALTGLYVQLSRHGLDARAFTGAATADELVAARPSPAALHAHALFGSGLPLVGAYPADGPSLMRELEQHGADAAVDRRLGCHLVHELCHGPPRACAVAPSWMVAEAAANHLGAAARAADVFPDEPGEGLRAVSLFVMLGDVMARHFGAAALWRVSTGAPLAALFGPSVAQALDDAGWEDWRARQEPPFARDALGVEAWLKLVDAARGGLTLGVAPLASASRVSWQALPWWQAPPDEADYAMLPRGLTALFQVNALAPDFRTLPAEPPGARLWIDVAGARLHAEPRSDGAWGEPAWWIFPPPLARTLFTRGARRVRIEGATRARRGELAAAIAELCAGSAPLAAETELSWACST